jgi:quinol monooxygenase YgiN
MSDSLLLVVAELHGRGGLAGELRALLEDLAANSRQEADCADMRVLSAADAGEYVLLSSWRSETGLREHYDTHHYRYYRDHVAPMLARTSDVVVHHVSESIRALDPNLPDPGLFG